MKVGKAAATIKQKGNYEGTFTKTFTIYPKGTTVTGKIAAKSRGLNVKWKKQPKSTTGHQIQKKKYYVRIRTYKIVKGKKSGVYPLWYFEVLV